MTSLLKSVSKLLSNPITATPNALAFSSPASSQLTPSTFSPSDQKTLPSSPFSSMTSSGGPMTIKKKKFKGWVCDDEISESEPALLEKLEAHGRDFSATPLASKPKSDAKTTKPSAESDPSSRVTAGRFNVKGRKTERSESNCLSRSKRKGPPAASTKRQSKSKNNRQSQKTAFAKSREIADISQKSPSHGSANPSEPAANTSTVVNQPPRKKPRFCGYVCDDEAEEEDPALADLIRRKGTVFQLKKAAGSKEPSSRAATEDEEGSQEKPFPTKTQPSNSVDAPSLQKRHPKVASTQDLKAKLAQPQRSTARSARPQGRSKQGQKKKSLQRRTPAATVGPLFPNLATNSPITPSTTSTPPLTTPNKNSNSTPLARAEERVATSTSDLKRLNAIADQAAKAAEIAKRKAGDAANKVEEAKRMHRVEKEKEKMKKEGMRYQSGYATLDGDGEGQGWDEAGSTRKRARAGGRPNAEQASHQVNTAAKLEDHKDKNRKEEVEEEEEEEEDEDEDEDEDDDEDEDEDDDEEDDTIGDATDDDDDVDDEFESGEDEDELPLGRTADLLG